MSIYIFIKDQSELESYSEVGLLSSSESEYGFSLASEARRLEFFLGRSFVKKKLSEFLDCSPQDIETSVVVGEKPQILFLGQASKWHFNASHSGSLFLFAFSDHTEVGVDIEVARPLHNLNELAQQVMSTTELRAFRQLTPQEQQAAFLRLWVQKEAILKLLNLGVGKILRDIHVEVNPWMPMRLYSLATICPSNADRSILFEEVDVRNGVAAVAYFSASGENEILKFY